MSKTKQSCLTKLAYASQMIISDYRLISSPDLQVGPREGLGDRKLLDQVADVGEGALGAAGGGVKFALAAGKAEAGQANDRRFSPRNSTSAPTSSR